MKSKDIIDDFVVWYANNKKQVASRWEEEKLKLFLNFECDIHNITEQRNAMTYSAIKSVHEEVHRKFKLVREAINTRVGFQLLRKDEFVEFMSKNSEGLRLTPSNYINLFKEK